METTNTTITNITRRKDRTLPLRVREGVREVSQYADNLAIRETTTKKQSHAEGVSGSLYIYAIILYACNRVGVLLGGVTIL